MSDPEGKKSTGGKRSTGKSDPDASKSAGKRSDPKGSKSTGVSKSAADKRSDRKVKKFLFEAAISAAQAVGKRFDPKGSKSTGVNFTKSAGKRSDSKGSKSTCLSFKDKKIRKCIGGRPLSMIPDAKFPAPLPSWFEQGSGAMTLRSGKKATTSNCPVCLGVGSHSNISKWCADCLCRRFEKVDSGGIVFGDPLQTTEMRTVRFNLAHLFAKPVEGESPDEEKEESKPIEGECSDQESGSSSPSEISLSESFLDSESSDEDMVKELVMEKDCIIECHERPSLINLEADLKWKKWLLAHPEARIP